MTHDARGTLHKLLAPAPAHGLCTRASRISGDVLIAGICAGARDRVEELRCESSLSIPVAFEIVSKPRSSTAVMGECRIHFHASSMTWLSGYCS